MRGDLAAMLYVGDYFTDTLHLCAAEHAILQYLLLQLWIHGPGIFDIDLAPAGLGLDEWQSVQATLFPLALNACPRIAGSLARLRAACGQRLPSEDWDVVRSIVFERDKRCCVYCGSAKDLQGDHVVPLCRGGSNALNNVVTACAVCNRSNKVDPLIQAGPDTQPFTLGGTSGSCPMRRIKSRS